MTRASVTVFIETSHEGDAVDAAIIFGQALRQLTGGKLEFASAHLGTIDITIHDSMETGMALGNGYLWAAPTSKAFPRQEEANE